MEKKDKKSVKKVRQHINILERHQRGEIRGKKNMRNRMFVYNQKRVYQQMDGIRNINNEKPNAEESKQF